MPLRLVEITVPTDEAPGLREILGNLVPDALRQERQDDGQMTARVLLDAAETGGLVDAVEDRFAHLEGFVLLMLPVEAALPRPPEPPPSPPPEPDPGAPDAALPAPKAIFGAVSREELYADVMDMTKLSRVYVATVVLSTIVAAVGVLRENVAVIIGAMVIAPLLGPNVGLALATTLGDTSLLRRALAANIVGIGLALVISIGLGAAFAVDPASAEIANRSSAEMSDVALALASGAAGALAMTTAVPTALVGVMVAAALLPPTVVVGLMAGSGSWGNVTGPLLLLVTNVICVNLAGVITFLAQGVRPLTWWEANRARQATRRALVIWVVLLAALVALILLARP